MSAAEPLRSGEVRPPSKVEALSLFGFLPWVATLVPPAATDDGAVRLCRAGELAALFGVVRVADYCGADGERNLVDLAWLAPRLRHHAALVTWAMQHGPVLPAPFATLYQSEASLGAFMRAHATTITAFLASVAGKEEWELRTSLCPDADAGLERLARIAWPDWNTLSPGTRYMRLRRDRGALLVRARAEGAAVAEAVVASLAPLAAATRRRAVSAGSGDGEEIVARHALLVACADTTALADRVRTANEAHAERGLTISVSGPLPPFSFRPDLGPA